MGPPHLRFYRPRSVERRWTRIPLHFTSTIASLTCPAFIEETKYRLYNYRHCTSWSSSVTVVHVGTTFILCFCALHSCAPPPSTTNNKRLHDMGTRLLARIKCPLLLCTRRTFMTASDCACCVREVVYEQELESTPQKEIHSFDPLL